MSIRSMTGYARVRHTGESATVTVNLKAVNHRALDLHFHLPPMLDPVEPELRARLKAALSRGHIDIRIQLEQAGTDGTVSINHALLDAYIEAHKLAASRHGILNDPDVVSMMRFPGVMGDAAGQEIAPALAAQVLATFDAALAQLQEFRQREGGELTRVIGERLEAIRAAGQAIGGLRKDVLEVLQRRLEQKLLELLSGTTLEPQRIVQEAAMLADRSDIGEEISRLEIHCNELHSVLTVGGEVGKKIDFLAQEMNREVNTMLSKTSSLGPVGLAVTKLGVAAKSDIEKIREQSLNLE